jgi:hypothetical protein
MNNQDESSSPNRDEWRKKRNKLVSDTPVLLSLLYDLNLLPEQVADGSHEEWRLDTVVCHVLGLPQIMTPIPHEPPRATPTDLTQSRKECADLLVANLALEADAAVMRGALGSAEFALVKSYDATEWPSDGTSPQEICVAKIRAILDSTNAGADLLCRYREALWLLQNKGLGPYQSEEWSTRRDALLATVKGGDL